MSDKAEMSVQEKIKTVIKVINSGKEHLNKAQELVLSKRGVNGQYSLNDQDVALFLSHFGVMSKVYGLLSEMHLAGAKARGVDIEASDFKTQNLSGVASELNDVLIRSIELRGRERTEQEKLKISQELQAALPKFFGPEVLTNEKGPITPGFKGLKRYKENILDIDSVSACKWPIGFYATDDQGLSRQFFIKDSLDGKTLCFCFVLPSQHGSLDDPLLGDLYVSSDSPEFKKHSSNGWSAVNRNFVSMTINFRRMFISMLKDFIESH
jgi:hypothetical protein